MKEGVGGTEEELEKGQGWVEMMYIQYSYMKIQKNNKFM